MKICQRVINLVLAQVGSTNVTDRGSIIAIGKS
jgi:hypothetical protein